MTSGLFSARHVSAELVFAGRVLPRGMKRFFPTGTSGLSSAILVVFVVTLQACSQVDCVYLGCFDIAGEGYGLCTVGP